MRVKVSARVRVGVPSGMGSPASAVPDAPLGDDGCHGGGEAAATMSAIAGVWHG